MSNNTEKFNSEKTTSTEEVSINAPQVVVPPTDAISAAQPQPGQLVAGSNNKLFNQKPKLKEDNPHNNIVVYAVAFITLGAAFCNMFIAGKVKRTMNVKIPTFDADSSYRKFQQQAAQEQVRRASQQANRARYNQDGRKFDFQEEFTKYKEYAGKTGSVPSWTAHDRNLHLLGLKRHQCNEADIKKAFFALAKVHHPDTLPHDLSPQEKQLRVKKFQEINQAYQDLLQQVKLMDAAGTHP